MISITNNLHCMVLLLEVLRKELLMYFNTFISYDSTSLLGITQYIPMYDAIGDRSYSRINAQGILIFK